MKKNLFIYAALCALVATGCSKQDEAETLQPEQGEALNITISATRHEAPSTRTEYEEGTDELIVKWKSDRSDKLGVFTTVGNDVTTSNNAPFAVDGALSADGKTANFKGSLNVSWSGQEARIYGYYPYSDAAGDTPEAIPIDLGGQAQDGITDKESLAHLAAKDYMAATPVTKKLSSGDQNLSLEFHPLLTIMSFKITQAMNVKSIKLEAVGDNNKTPFYTRRAVDITSTTFPFTSGGTKQSSVELNVTNGTISSTGMFNMMIFPIITDNMPTHFKVTVTTTDGDIYEQTKPAPAYFERGKRYIMELDGLTTDDKVWDGNIPAADDNYAYSGGAGTPESSYQIATANDLAQLSANVNAKFDTSDSFILAEDIDLNGHEWTPIGKEGANFKGTFDGGSKTITGMKITIPQKHVGLFGYAIDATATIKDLNVTGEINIGTTDLVINAGGILGEGYKATLSGNLTNHVNITIKDGGSSLNIGGVAGLIAGKAVADAKLTNDGILNINGKGEVFVGGVIGYIIPEIQSGTTLNNSGAVSGISSGSSCNVGGLIGCSGASVTFEGTNSGNVRGEITGGSSKNVCCGGLIGFIAKTISKTNTNTGDVTAISSSTYSCWSYAGICVGGAIKDDTNPNVDFPDLKKKIRMLQDTKAQAV